MQGLFWDKSIKGWVDDPDYATIYQTLLAATATIPEAKKALKGVKNPEKMWAGAVIRGAVTAHGVYSSLTPEQKPIARKLIGQLLRSGGRPWKQRRILKSPEAKALFSSLTPEQKQQIVAAGMSKGKKKFETGGSFSKYKVRDTLSKKPNSTGKVRLNKYGFPLEDFESEYKGEIIMHWPDRKPLQWFSNDQTFDSLKEVKEYIDKGSPMDERTINAYRHGAFEKGGGVETKIEKKRKEIKELWKKYNYNPYQLEGGIFAGEKAKYY